MADDIDIGIGVHANPDAQQVLEQLRAKLAALRNELAATAAAQSDVSGGSTQGGAAASANASAAAANQAIGAFVKMGQVIDATNAAAVRAFREEGDAISSYLVKLGATDAELNKVGAAIARVEQRSGAARFAPIDSPIKPVPPGTIESYDKIPGRARTAANAFSLLALSAASGTGSLQSMAVAAGGLVTGLSGLAGPRLFAAASGIGAAVTILAVLIELLHEGTEATQKQDAALKSFTETNESFAARSRAVADAVAFLNRIPGNNASAVQLIGITKAVDDLDKAVIKAKKDLTETVNTPSFTQLQAAEFGDTGAAELAKLSKELQALRVRFAEGKVSTAAFNDELKRIGAAHPSFAEEIAQTASLAANYDRLLEARAKEAAAAQQQIAIEAQTKLAFGLTPDLARALDQVNQQFIALHSGGAIALQSVQDQQKAISSATDAWKQYVTSVEGSHFATVTFDQAITKSGAELKKLAPELQTAATAKANSLLQTATAVVQTSRQVEGGVALADLARTSTEKAAQAVLARTQNEAAARRKAADDEFEQGKRQALRMAGLETDRARVIQALTIQHGEAIRRINKEEDDKVTALLAQLSDERIQAEARLSDDEFGQRRAAARRQFDADQKRITDAKLTIQKEAAARLDTQRSLDANLAAAEKDRTTRLREIDLSAKQQIDELTGRTGEADPAKIRAGFKQQLDVLAATIASADTTEVEKELARQGQRDIEALIPLEVAKARMGELAKIVSAAATTGNAEVARATLLVNAHAISQSQARQDIVAALTKERDAIQATLPMLEAEAANLPGNAEAQAQLEQYRTRLLELNIAIEQTGDQFFKLKETTRDAVTSSLATFFEDATKLGTQSHAEINSFKAELASAQDELQDLLAKANRSPGDNQRITALRSEIQQTTLSLDNAKESLRSWRDLFLSAAQSIIDALVKVSSQMLATALIERLFETIGKKKGGGGDLAASAAATTVAATALSSAGVVVGSGAAAIDASAVALGAGAGALDASSVALDASGAVLLGAAAALEAAAASLAAAGAATAVTSAFAGFAEGGPVRGPGTGTSDSILARLSNREFVQPARATAFYGEDWMEAQRRLLLPRELTRALLRGITPMVLRPRISTTHFADGGLVTAASNTGIRANEQSFTHTLIIRGLPAGAIVDHLDSPDGHRVLVKIVADRPNAFNAALGR